MYFAVRQQRALATPVRRALHPDGRRLQKKNPFNRTPRTATRFPRLATAIRKNDVVCLEEFTRDFNFLPPRLGSGCWRLEARGWNSARTTVGRTNAGVFCRLEERLSLRELGLRAILIGICRLGMVKADPAGRGVIRGTRGGRRSSARVEQALAAAVMS